MVGKKIISEILAGKVFDKKNNSYLNLPIRKIAIENDIAPILITSLNSMNIGESCLIVADKNTSKAATKLINTLKANFRAEILIFDSPPLASVENSESIIVKAKNSDFIIAVGSGTINDLCKYAAHTLQKEYIVIATAASMNGYCSSTASLIKNGCKTSLPAKLPIAAYFDLGILLSSPLELTKSGIGDLLCRTTAQTDWLLSHLLLDSEYNELPYSLLKPVEEKLLQQNNIGSAEFMELLCYGLVISGLGMHICGGSYPASQGEHIIAHYIETFHPVPPSFHGEQIGVLTLIASTLQDKLLQAKPSLNFNQDFYKLFIKRSEERFGAESENFISVIRQKFSQDKINIISQRLQSNWPEILKEINSKRLKTGELKSFLKRNNIKSSIEELGWSKEILDDALKYSCFTRDRFTFLDLNHLFLY